MRVLLTCVTLVGFAATRPSSSAAEDRALSDHPPTGPFGYGLINTADGQPLDADVFLPNDVCAVCHPRQQNEFQGSMHTASHSDPLYRSFAEAARREAGEQVYTYCSSCHASVGVAARLIPSIPESQLPSDIKAGVTCDTCHHISALTGVHGPWREEGNASFVLQAGSVRFGPSAQVTENRLHTSEKRDFFAKAEFCASCHTVIHPTGGMRIENTYGEWKASVYAEHGIQCQNCHMSQVEDAARVAQSLQPVVREGQSAQDGPVRQVFSHFFVGANVDADHLAQGPFHSQMAVARLQSAARVQLQAPATVQPGREFHVDVVVQNVAAGHNLPTGVTELRQMWVELTVLDKNEQEIFVSGNLDEHGDFRPDTIWYGAVAADADGKPTLKPWEMTRFLSHRTIPPKGEMHDRVTIRLPADTAGPLTIRARLLYRSAAPSVAAQFMGAETFVPKITQMTTAQVTLCVE